MRIMQGVVFSVALLAVAGCGQSTPSTGPTTPAADTVRPPLLQSAYRVEAQLLGQDGEAPMPLVLVRDGAKTRIEMTSAEHGQAVFIVRDGEALMISSAMGQPMAMRVPASSAPALPDQNWAATQDGNVRRIGDCNVIGEAGSRYQSQDTGEGVPGEACITQDGIMLEASEGGRVVWQATRVQRGPQDPALFEPPAGVTVVDMGDMAARAQAAADRFKQQ